MLPNNTYFYFFFLIGKKVILLIENNKRYTEFKVVNKEQNFPKINNFPNGTH